MYVRCHPPSQPWESKEEIACFLIVLMGFHHTGVGKGRSFLAWVVSVTFSPQKWNLEPGIWSHTNLTPL